MLLKILFPAAQRLFKIFRIGMGEINCLRSAAHNVFPVVFEENISLISRSIFNRFEVVRHKLAAFRKNRNTVLIRLFTENIYPRKAELFKEIPAVCTGYHSCFRFADRLIAKSFFKLKYSIRKMQAESPHIRINELTAVLYADKKRVRIPVFKQHCHFKV